MAAHKDPFIAPNRGCPSVEIYRTPSGRDFGYRVISGAADNSADALRSAKALALAVEDELHTDLETLAEARRNPVKREAKYLFPAEHRERIEALAADENITPAEYLRRIVAAHLDEVSGSA